MTSRLALALVMGAAFVDPTHAGPPVPRPLGDSQVIAPIPQHPGFPEGIAVRGNRIYVSGPAQFGNFEPPTVLVFDRDSGAVVDTHVIEGENPALPQALAGIAFDGAGRLYVLDLQLGVVRIDTGSGDQEIYAPALPDLPPCFTVPPGTLCSPTASDRGPIPNELAFDSAGNLYATDSFQATLWRIPPGGGTPVPWFQDARLDTPFGANGFRIDASGLWAYFTLTIGAMGEGVVYKLPMIASPQAPDLVSFHQFGPGEAPDGIAFGKSGLLYVTLAGPSAVAVLGTEGTEVARHHGPSANRFGLPDPLPWANPSAIAFSSRDESLLVTNHAIFHPGPDRPYAVFDVFVNDRGLPLAQP